MLELVFLIKIIIFSTLIIIWRGTLPRYRIDQFLLDTWISWVFILLAYLFLLVLSLSFFFL